MTRKEKYSKRKHLRIKLLIGVLLLSSTVAGNIGIAFADQDIQSLLTNWFNQKGQESISTIESAILTEKEQQKARLKEELQSELQNSDKMLDQFTEEEKQKRILALQEYANQLIENMKLDNNKEEKQRITAEMDQIIQRAIKDLNKVKPREK